MQTPAAFAALYRREAEALVKSDYANRLAAAAEIEAAAKMANAHGFITDSLGKG